MENLLQQLQKPSFYKMGLPSPPSVQPPTRINLMRHLYQVRGPTCPILPSNRSAQPLLHTVISPTILLFQLVTAPCAAHAFQTATLHRKSVKTVKSVCSAPRFFNPLQQPFFFSNRTDQLHNRLGVEAGESSAHSKPTNFIP